MAYTTKVSNTWRLPLPREMCDDMGIKPGDTLCLFTAAGTLYMVQESKLDAVKAELRLRGITIEEED